MIDVGRMIPGIPYRVTHRIDDNETTHEGQYLGREVSAVGDLLMFAPPLTGGDPILIAIAAVISVETLD